MENQEALFTIPEHRMDEFKERIAALNKKAVKVGVAAITIEVVEKFDRSYSEHPVTGEKLVFPMVIRFYKVRIDGIEPKFSGWTFLARIDHDGEMNIINAVPGVELDIRYRTLGPVCEHCKVKRYRKSSFVVRHESGEEKQVGSGCLKDFLGHGTPEAVASYCESIFSFIRGCSDDEFRYGGKIEHRFDLIGVLAITSAVIRKEGWLSASKARELGGVPTASYICDYLIGTDKGAAELRKEVGHATEDDKALAEKAVEWLKTKEDTGDYFYNLKTVCNNGTIELKRIGLVASLIPVYRRDTEKAIERTAKEPSAWIGHPDMERMTLKGVKVVGIGSTDGFRGGVTWIYRFLANGKDKLTWFSSNEQDIEQGDTVDMVFKVKKLDEYKGEHQTIITRAKITVKARAAEETK